MKNIHIKDYENKHVHFIGIGGISMSGLAEILHNKGYRVSGSDLKKSGITRHLESLGIKVYEGHKEENIQGANLIIYTAAIKKDNPEIIEAKRFNIPQMDRATLLGQLMDTYSYSIGVSGTHGKTTTTSMLSIILEHASLDPTILVGGELDAIGGNVRTGNSKYFVTEACEYVESFLKFKPYMAIILNIEKDHLDYYRDLEHIYSAFLKYAELVPKNGYVIGSNDDPLIVKLLNTVQSQTISFAIDKPADWRGVNLKYDKDDFTSFNVLHNGEDLGRFTLKVPGKHNVYNALASIAAASTIGISTDKIKEALLLYKGTHRRFEIKGTTDKDVTVIDDYAHHPTEIKATLKTAKDRPHNNIWCVFQPHTYSRTKALFNDFVSAFDDADNLIFADIYAAREKDPGDVNSKMLSEAINKTGRNSIYLPDFKQIVSYLNEHIKPGDIVITMGAGNINEVGEIVLNQK